MGLLSNGLARRARRALDRQLAYQKSKTDRPIEHDAARMRLMAKQSRAVREKLEFFCSIVQGDRVLEVGSGAHGLIFYFGTDDAIGIDPLADHYARLFPAWQSRVRTIAASGERLPFPDGSFDIVLCDNVVDHAENPRGIIEEIVRVLRPDGLLYFTVNVHHPLYHWAASAHAGWRAIGIPFEITPFADHTVHLTPGAAKRLFADLPLLALAESDTVAETRRSGRELQWRHSGLGTKKLFYKNANYRLISRRLGVSA